MTIVAMIVVVVGQAVCGSVAMVVMVVGFFPTHVQCPGIQLSGGCADKVRCFFGRPVLLPAAFLPGRCVGEEDASPEETAHFTGTSPRQLNSGVLIVSASCLLDSVG